MDRNLSHHLGQLSYHMWMRLGLCPDTASTEAEKQRLYADYLQRTAKVIEQATEQIRMRHD